MLEAKGKGDGRLNMFAVNFYLEYGYTAQIFCQHPFATFDFKSWFIICQKMELSEWHCY